MLGHLHVGVAYHALNGLHIYAQGLELEERRWPLALSFVSDPVNGGAAGGSSHPFGVRWLPDPVTICLKRDVWFTFKDRTEIRA